MSAHTHSLRWHPPQGQPVKQQSVYLLHGTGEHAGRYEHLAERLTNAGYRVGAHDHPGHGRSSGKRGVFDPPGQLATQAAIQCQHFAAETGCAPVLFGHSLGGVLAAELVIEHGMPVAGLILSAPAFVPYVRKRDLLQVKLLAHVAPTFSVERPYNASRLTHDEAIREQAEADPLNHGFKSASLVQWLLRSGSRQLAKASELNTDTLLLIAGADPVINSLRTREFANQVADERISVHEYDGFLHEILNETPERAERVFADIMHWMSQRFADS